MKLIESFTIAKTGMEQANEDGYYIDNSFVAVIDGATSKKVEIYKESLAEDLQCKK